jgi:putative transposase
LKHHGADRPDIRTEAHLSRVSIASGAVYGSAPTAVLELDIESVPCSAASVSSSSAIFATPKSVILMALHIRGAPFHPQTQGKIERWHQTLKNRILLENYYLPGDLEAQINAFVDHYNNQRYHEAIGNLTPADVYFGRGNTILLERERIKRQTIQSRRLMHARKAA